MKRAAAIVASLLLPFLTCGIAAAYPLLGPPDAPPPEKLQNIKNIGVSFDPAEPLNITSIGTTAFTNASGIIPASDLHFDTVIIQAVADTLGSKFTSGPSDIAFSTIRQRLFNSYTGQLKALVTATADRKFDAYLNFRFTDSANDPIAGTNQKLHGMGIYRRNLFDLNRDAAYYFVSIDLIDGQTGERMAGQALCFSAGGGKCDHRYWQPLTAGHWVEPDATPSDEQKQALRDDFTAILKDGIRGALTEMGLADTSK